MQEIASKNCTYSLINKYKLTVIKPAHMMQASKIKLNVVLQRLFEAPRFTKIKESILEYGYYWPSSVLTLNENLEVIDGQHRLKAAMALGIYELPVCIVTFGDKRKEAQFFSDLSNHNTALNPVTFWNARFLAGHPLATFVYLLESSEESLLCDKIAIKGKDSKKTRWTVVSVINCISYICLGLQTNWRKDRDKEITATFLKYSTQDIAAKLMPFVRWFELCFGSKSQGSLAYNERNFTAIMKVYNLMNYYGCAHKTDTINKMKSFYFSSELKKLPDSAITQLIVAHYNKGKTKRTIEMK